MLERIDRIIILTVVVSLMTGLLLAGCGKKSEDPNLGVYAAKEASMSGISISVEDAFEDGFTIELQEKGKCILTVDGDTAKGKWELDDGEFTVSGGGIDCSGTLSDGVMELIDVMGAGLNLTLINDDYKAPEDSDEEGSLLPGLTKKGKGSDKAELIEKTETQKYWNGDWYGYLFFTDGTGAYESMNNRCWDASAMIDIDENGNGTITLWYFADVDAVGTSYDDPIAYSEISVSENGGSGSHGEAVSTSGWAMSHNNAGAVGNGDWVLDPGYDSHFSDMMTFGSEYTDSTGSTNYQFVLRPWGNRWSEVKEDDAVSVMPRFKTWYLPLIEDGLAMPLDYKSTPSKTMKEREKELLAPAEKKSSDAGNADAGDADTKAAADEPSETVDLDDLGETYSVTPTGSSYTWGNITVNVPDGMDTSNGNAANHDDKDSLSLTSGTKYIMISKKEIEWCEKDIATSKEMNNGEDASFTVNDVNWVGTKYDYSGSPCWQVYGTVNGNTYEVGCYGYYYNGPEALTVFSSLN